jgi:hypothetical protein
LTAIEARDLNAVESNAKSDEDTRTPVELLDIIEVKGREVTEAPDSASEHVWVLG